MKSFVLKMTQTAWNYYLSLFVDGATAIVFLILSIRYSQDFWASLALFVVGMIAFTFLEYAVHAWLFHKKHPLKVFIEGHAHHHQNPFSYDAMPFFMSAVLASILAWMAHFLMPTSDTLALIGGLTLGYFNYGVMHHIMHRTEFKHPYLKYLQEFHLVHHAKPKKNNGVTTDIWDRFFNTYTTWTDEDIAKLEKLKRL